ncbi:hypothetical protein [Nocardia alni]|uniref:hypothetical protein n=1 Tax=Nocardia alni TaxID=2815723 RepID=UPI001C23A163|nr:hypothetical protein [Nocardia alni]
MTERDAHLTFAQAGVLRALNIPGELTEPQIRFETGLTVGATRQTVVNLVQRALVVTPRPGRYQITRLGRNTLAATASGYGQEITRRRHR